MKKLAIDEIEFLQQMFIEEEEEFNKNFDSFMEELDKYYHNKF